MDIPVVRPKGKKRQKFRVLGMKWVSLQIMHVSREYSNSAHKFDNLDESVLQKTEAVIHPVWIR